MDVSILGPLTVVADGRMIAVRGSRRRTLLTRLAVADGRAVSVDELFEDLWAGDPPRTAGANVQTYVHQLRRLLGPDGTRLVTRDGGYALELDHDALDARRFENLVQDARATDDAEAARASLDRALALWRGRALEEFGDLDWARGPATRLETLRLGAVEARVDAMLATGHHVEAVAELEELVEQHPLRERFWAQLVLALYRSGRQADALRAYRRVREMLVEELGVEPSGELAGLEQRVLDHDDSLAWRPAQSRTTPGLPTGVVTFLLTDVEGSTAQWDRDAGAMAEAIARHDAVLRDAVTASGGVVLKARGEGDSVFAVFTKATSAAFAALDVQRRLADASDAGRGLAVRIAVHTGEALERDGDYFGPTVNRAARLRGLAAGGEILVSRATADLVRDQLSGGRLVDRGVRRLRGLSRPEHVFALEPAGAGDPSPSEPSARASTVSTPRDTDVATIVGRARHLERLEALWTTASDAHLSVAVLEGEPGIGKTTLAQRFASGCATRGIAVLGGRAPEQHAMPYQPFVEALTAWATGGEPLAEPAGVGPGRRTLVRLVPALDPALTPADDGAHADPESERYWLFEAIASLLAAIAREHGLLLVVDDVQWLDESSSSLLTHLLRSLDGARAMVLVVVRNALERGARIRDVLAEIHRAAATTWLSLDGLSVDDVAILASLEPGVARAVHDVTGGNPFFTLEIVRHLRADDALEERDVRAGSLPQGISETVVARVARLGDDVERVLRHAAVLGDDFDLPSLATMVDLTQDTTIDALDDALAAHVLVESDGSDRFRFAHALVRRVLYQQLSLARRQRMHARAVGAIESAYADDLAPHLSALATHSCAAGPAVPLERGVAYSIEAGLQCRRVSAYAEAVAHWTRALELADGRESVARERARLHELLGQLLFSTGTDTATGIDHLHAALALGQQLGDHASTARVHSRLGQVLSSMPECMDVPAALDHFRAAQAVLDETAAASRPYLYTGFAAAALYAAENREGRAAAARAIELAETTQAASSARWLAVALDATHEWHLGGIATGLPRLEEAWSRADADNDAVTSFFAAWMRGWAAVLLLDPTDGRAWFERELARPRIDGMPRNRDTLRTTRAICDLLQGGARAGGDGATDTVGHTPNAPLYESLDALRHRPWHDAEKLLDAELERLRRAGDRADVYLLGYWLAHLHALREARGEAVDVLAELLDVPPEQHVPPCYEIVLRAELARLGTNPEENLAWCHTTMSDGAWRGLHARVALAEATAVAASAGADADVDRAYGTACGAFRQHGLAWDEAETLVDWSAACAAAGRGDSARRLADEAADRYRALDASSAWTDRIPVAT